MPTHHSLRQSHLSTVTARQVHLCATCQAHLRYIVIANERRGNGAGVDFFVGDPGSSLKLEDSYRLRLACTSTSAQQPFSGSGSVCMRGPSTCQA